MIKLHDQSERSIQCGDNEIIYPLNLFNVYLVVSLKLNRM